MGVPERATATASRLRSGRLSSRNHGGYIGWAEFDWNQKQLAVNTYGKLGGTKSGRGG